MDENDPTIIARKVATYYKKLITEGVEPLAAVDLAKSYSMSLVLKRPDEPRRD